MSSYLAEVWETCCNKRSAAGVRSELQRWESPREFAQSSTTVEQAVS